MSKLQASPKGDAEARYKTRALPIIPTRTSELFQPQSKTISAKQREVLQCRHFFGSRACSKSTLQTRHGDGLSEGSSYLRGPKSWQQRSGTKKTYLVRA